MKDISIIIPAYNEEENLRILLPELINVFKGTDYEIILVNNASTDNTKKLIEDMILSEPRLVHIMENKLGYGQAVLTGLKNSKGNLLGIIRADNQEKPHDMLRMFKRCIDNNIEFCKAVRNTRKSEGHRRVITSSIYNSLFRLLFNTHVRDVNATPKIFSRKFYEDAELKSTDWFIDAELVIRAIDLNYKIDEVEIEYRPRLKGVSKVRLTHVLQFVRNMLAWRSRPTPEQKNV